MSYLSKDYTKFFVDLEKNNNKEWFNDNKKRYLESVREPLIALVSDLITAMQKIDPAFDPVPARCLSRINRDIRFSKDKTLYKDHMFAHITKGPKNAPLPGIGFRFGAHDAGIMSGYFNPTKEQLIKIRKKIIAEPKAFRKLVDNKKFVEKFGVIQGEVMKRIPEDFQYIYDNEPYVANKQFFYAFMKKKTFAQSPKLLEEILAAWKIAKPLNDFFE